MENKLQQKICAMFQCTIQFSLHIFSKLAVSLKKQQTPRNNKHFTKTYIHEKYNIRDSVDGFNEGEINMTTIESEIFEKYELNYLPNNIKKILLYWKRLPNFDYSDSFEVSDNYIREDVKTLKEFIKKNGTPDCMWRTSPCVTIGKRLKLAEYYINKQSQ